MNISALAKRLAKLEKSASAAVTVYSMPDGLQIALTNEQRQRGMSDAVCNNADSFEGNVLLSAVRSNDGSGILPLIWAVVNPVNTQEPNEMEGMVE